MTRVIADLSDWQYLRGRTAFVSREEILGMVVRLSYQVPGHIMEFGVAEGGSTRTIRSAASEYEKTLPAGASKQIFACDSFLGLPEKYENAEVGTFATEPPRIPGVDIIIGYFQDSLTDDLASKIKTVAFASLDADLYSSTICALNWLTPLLRTGSLLLFDEFLGESGSEKRAFEEWSKDTETAAILIGEFMREPSGWGSTLDKRALFQIVQQGRIPWPKDPQGES